MTVGVPHTWAVLIDHVPAPTMALQPIKDVHGVEVGVELLFRNPPADGAPELRSEADHEFATTTVVDLLRQDMDTDATGLLFVNAPRAFLVGEQPLPRPHGRIVVEILEGTVVTDEVVAGVRDLVSRGYKVAVDDWEGGDDRVDLLALADFVKIDLEAVSCDRLPGLVAEAHVARPGVSVVVERIETPAQLQAAVAAGADLFQGYLLASPDLL